MQFHNAVGVIPGDTTDKEFLDARATALFLNIQKDYVRCESTTMETTGLKHADAVSAAARRFMTPPFAHTILPMAPPSLPFQAVISHAPFA